MDIAENLVASEINNAVPNVTDTTFVPESEVRNAEKENTYENIFPLIDEILAADGLLSQDPTTGREIVDMYGNLVEGKKQIVRSYTTNLFGLPFQLLDSVDGRFESVNENVGYEFLRTFIMHSPILHLSPGLPLFTGGDRATEKFLTQLLHGGGGSSFSQERVSGWQTVLVSAAKSFLKNKIQRRMFGIMYNYENYMSYVNLLCRSVALLLKLVTSDGSGKKTDQEYPNGVFVNTTESSGNQSKGNLGFVDFTKVNWGNYRYESNSQTFVKRDEEKLKDLGKSIGNTFEKILKAPGDWLKNIFEGGNSIGYNVSKELSKNTSEENKTDLAHYLTIYNERAKSVQFVVDPQGASESYRNDLKDSEITQVLSKANSIGSEVAFYTGANIDAGLVGPIMDAAGKLSTSVIQALNNATTGITGGFAHNLISGALGALQGERMIFPKIYDKSESSSSYNFKVNLASPYGDVYNYFINIVVPYLHILALAAPREVSSNASKTPFIVKAFIPGLCTCEMGMITNLQISKNPETQHISANGFPLSVSIDFTISELYNHMAISSEYDPYTFMFNETLMDYLCNLSGIYPTFNRLAYQSSLALSGWDEMINPNEGITEGVLKSRMIQQMLYERTGGAIINTTFRDT